MAHSEFGRLYLVGGLRTPAEAAALAASRGDRGELDEREAARYHAGELYGAVAARYRAAIMPPRDLRSGVGGFDVAATSLPVEEVDASEPFRCPTDGAEPIERDVRLAGVTLTVRTWPCGESDEGCGCARRAARYNAAHEAVTGTAGLRAARAVAKALRGEGLAPSDRIYLVLALDALARHFGLTRR